MHKEEVHIPYQVFKDFVFRTPVMPVNFIEEVYHKGIYKTIGRHREIIDQAVFLASPNLHRKLLKRLTGQLKEEELEFDLSLLKYLTRMATRCTPFGIFAGIGTGQFGDRNEIIISEPAKHSTHTKLSQDFLYDYVSKLVTEPEIVKSSIYFTNNTIYRKQHTFRYIEYFDRKDRRKYTLSSVDVNDILVKITGMCRIGAHWNELISMLEREGVESDEAKKYLKVLIENQIITNKLEPSPISDDMLSRLLRNINSTVGESKHYQFCSELKKGLEDLDKKGIGFDLTTYQRISKNIQGFFPERKASKAFHVDLGIHTSTAVLDQSLVEEIKYGLKILNRLTATGSHQLLSRFKQQFYNRYENEEIPLIEALDSESGIAVEETDKWDMNSLIEDIPTNRIPGHEYMEINIQNKFQLDTYHDYLVDQIHREGLGTLILDEDEVKMLPLNWSDIPATFVVLAEIVQNSTQTPLIYIKTAAGVNAAKTLSRFHQISPEIHQLIHAISEKENQLYADAIIAEILHLPQARVGNVLIRPEVYDYQIPIVSPSHNAPQYQIPVSDLMISVFNGKRILLRSKKLNARIIPRLSTAHNFTFNSIPIYRFLCYLQMQDLRPDISFGWSKLLSGRKLLPRVRSGNIVISPATWNMSPQDIPNSLNTRSGDFHRSILEFQEKWRLPDRVLLSRGDNKLLIDFRHLRSCQMLYSEVNGKPFTITEVFMDSGDSLIKDGMGRSFAGEYVFCFHKDIN